jgi:hypothetical protein
VTIPASLAALVELLLLLLHAASAVPHDMPIPTRTIARIDTPSERHHTRWRKLVDVELALGRHVEAVEMATYLGELRHHAEHLESALAPRALEHVATAISNRFALLDLHVGDSHALRAPSSCMIVR